MNSADVDIPMGNAELRLTLASIESEIADVKNIAMSTNLQATKTNGHVADAFKEIDKLKGDKRFVAGVWAVVVLILLPALGVTMLRVWDQPTLTQGQVKNDVQEGVNQALVNYEVNK